MSEEKASLNAKEVTVTTLNLYNYLAPPNAFYSQDNIYTESQWQQKQSWLRAHLSQLNSDIVAFQEVFSIEELKHQMKELGYSHFVTVDSPNIEDKFIYSQPVLALASRFPITSCSPVTLSQQYLPYDAFEFSRKPIHAVIEIPSLGPIDIYVIHFKSKRLELESEASQIEVSRWNDSTYGLWMSKVQRGFEAHLLHRYIVDNKLQTNRPLMLMGDFNNSIQGDEFSCLTFSNSDKNPTLANYVLHDGWELKKPTSSRPPTHFYGAHSQVLDYILLSDEFCNQSANRLATISDYSVNDQHIVDPRLEKDLYSSDHASVTVRISLD